MCFTKRGKNPGSENTYVKRPIYNSGEHMKFDGMENFKK